MRTGFLKKGQENDPDAVSEARKNFQAKFGVPPEQRGITIIKQSTRTTLMSLYPRAQIDRSLLLTFKVATSLCAILKCQDRATITL